jgi:superfamily II DNA helicase RecQ
MEGRVRVLVATVAFGMGVDKSDIRGIIHLDMPRTPENYI